MTKRNFAALLLLFVFGSSGCGGKPGPVPTVPPPAPTQAPAPTPTPDPVEELLASLTVEQKVGQLLVAGIDGTTAGADGAWAVREAQAGGIILFRRNVESARQLAALTNELKALNGSPVPLILSVDEEGGRVSRMPAELAGLPAPLDCVAAGGEPRALGQTLGELCRAFGFGMDFAPVADVWTNPDNTVIGDRAFSTDFVSAAELVPQAVDGLASAGVIPVVKHFPGHGDTLTDSHVGLPTVEKTVEELAAGELLPFRAAVEGGVPAVMVGHILMTALDPERPATLSPIMVDGLLRGELGFTGVVCTDDLTMGAVANTYGLDEAAVLAVEAGCDLLLVCHKRENLETARQALLDAVSSGRISTERLDGSVRRILALKLGFGLTDEAVEMPDAAALNERIDAILP